MESPLATEPSHPRAESFAFHIIQTTSLHPMNTTLTEPKNYKTPEMHGRGKSAVLFHALTDDHVTTAFVVRVGPLAKGDEESYTDCYRENVGGDAEGAKARAIKLARQLRSAKCNADMIVEVRGVGYFYHKQ